MSSITDLVDHAPAREAKPREAMVVTSHPLAVDAAAEVLSAGGSAVDACVTAAAVLGVVDPMSAGLGGDCFALVWEPRRRELHGFNGSGRAPAAASLQDLQRRGLSRVPERGLLPVTVPGALDAWAQLLERYGRRSLGQALEPAARAARDGFAVSPVVGRDWASAAELLASGLGTEVYLPAPAVGQRFAQPSLAATLERIASEGPDAFYRGPFAEHLDALSRERDGWIRAEDLAAHRGEWVTPLEGIYRGHSVYELPPNTQGVVVLEALALLDEFPLGDLPPDERAHLQIEAIKLAFADARLAVGDPEHSRAEELLAFEHLDARLADLEACRERASAGPAGPGGSDTVYVAAVDHEGGCCSLISSIYMHFGAAVVVDGVCLHNRGALFVTDEAHPGALRPGARPYHTIIPAMVFRSEMPWLVFGVVGGYQQPQAQVQLLVHLIDEGLSLRDAVDAPRFRWVCGDRVRLEAGVDPSIARGLAERGHRRVDDAGHGGFGGAQAILVEDALEGASDPRKDGRVARVPAPKD